MKIRDDVYRKLIDSCCQIFGKQPDELGEDTDFVEDLHAKSQNMSLLVNMLEDEFDIEIPFMKMRRCTTIGTAADFVAEVYEDM